MMKPGMNVKQRDIILIPVPFSDLSTSKRRPAIVISNSSYNMHSDDVICCAITSNPRNYAGCVPINNSDLESGYLKYESQIKPTKVFTLNKNLIIKFLAKLNTEKSKEVIRSLNSSICIEDVALEE
jgi:mRNA interferase MazF